MGGGVNGGGSMVIDNKLVTVHRQTHAARAAPSGRTIHF